MKINKSEPLYGNIPVESVRGALNRLIRRTAKDKDTEHCELWAYLYEMFKVSYGIELRCNNMPPLDYAEKEGHIENLYMLAQKIMPNRPSYKTSFRMI